MSATIDQTEDNIHRTMTGLKDGVATATAGLEQAQATMRDGMQKMMKGAEDLFAFGQGNMDAFARSGQILATGMQDMSQSFAAAARASFDETVGTVKAMAAVKSVKEAMDLQAGLLRSTMEKTVSHAGQMTDSSMKLSEQAFAPIGARLSLAADKFGRAG